jgi:DNA polymerase-3 subunit alpha
MTAFPHLRVQSDFTLGTGASDVKALVAEAKRLGIPAFALTDDANMYGAMGFSKEAAGSGIQPIIGAKIWVEVPYRKDVIHGSLTLLATDASGYKNICALVEQSWLPQTGPDGIERPNRLNDHPTLPLATFEDAEAFDGTIVLTGGSDGLLPRLVARDRSLAGEILAFLSDLAPGRCYAEFCRNTHPNAQALAIEDAIFEMATKEQLPCVATSETYYATRDRHTAFELLRAIREKGKVTGGVTHGPDTVFYHLRSAQEMAELFPDMPGALENAIAIARRCAFKAEGRKPLLPPFACGEGRTEDQELTSQAHEGLTERLLVNCIPEERHAEYRKRLEFEINVIQNMGFSGYFLIVSDFIKWSISAGIPVGPGRGSGAGSLVAYSLKITDLDPLPFGLLFERFLNPDRVSMPDFDVDFCQDRRGEVIRYVRQKYGADHVAGIVTFMEIKAKTALSDVGRVLSHPDHGDYPFGERKRLTSLVPDDPSNPLTLPQIMEKEPGFKSEIESSGRLRMLYENACTVEGLYRNSSSHAAGIIIAGKPIRDLVPVGYDDKAGNRLCQFDMKDSETAGLVKFDFLGLTTLSILREATSHIRNFYSLPDFDLSALPLDDPKVYELFAEGHTAGIFQFESGGMIKNLKDMKPTRIEDLIAANALYRPGPMEMFPVYNQCKNGHAEPDYPEPKDRTRATLEETFGIMVYQEQVMQIARDVAGYTLAQADLLRRAMGKKIKAEMDANKAKFIEGAVATGVKEKDASDLFEKIEKFASYGFNKSHAAAYTLVSYRTAYLKTHYPAAFFAAQLSYEKYPEKIDNIKGDMDRLGVRYDLPDINRSFKRYMPEVDAKGVIGVRFGLQHVKGLSDGLDELERIRAEGGPFKDLADFAKRAGKLFNKGQLTNLAQVGCFDSLDGNRRRALEAIQWHVKGAKSKLSQGSLFSAEDVDVQLPAEIAEMKPWDNKAEREFEALGFYLQSHPLDRLKFRLAKAGIRSRQEYVDEMVRERHADLSGALLAGLVKDFERKVSGKGNTYIQLIVEESKSSTYVLRFFGSRGAEMSLNQISSQLMVAKASREPIIVKTRMSQDARGEVAIWPDSIHLAADYLAKVRSDITIFLDHKSWEPSGAELESLEKLKTSGASDRDIAFKRTELSDGVAALDAELIMQALDALRADDDTSAVRVRIDVALSENRIFADIMPGRYLLSDGFEARVRSYSTFQAMHEGIVDRRTKALPAAA